MELKQIQTLWERYENLVSSETIAQILIRPQQFLDESIDCIIPNITLASDGPIVSGVFLFTAQYLCEARLTGNTEEFDVMLKNTIYNIRIKLGIHEVIRNAAAIEVAKSQKQELPAPEKVIYQNAEVHISHFYQSMHSQLNYFGQARDLWLATVRSALPVTILGASSDRS